MNDRKSKVFLDEQMERIRTRKNIRLLLKETTDALILDFSGAQRKQSVTCRIKYILRTRSTSA